jgi:hypothetical protein
MRRTLARSRAFLFLIVLAALLSPALVATSADAAATKYRVGIKLSDTNVVKGDSVLVTGKVRPVTTGKVLLQRRTTGGWSTLRKINLVASTYAANVRLNDVGVTFFRVIAPASKGLKKGQSKTRNVRVVSNASNPQIATATLPAGVVGTAYSAQVTTTDERAGTWSIGAGALPAGLTINPATGLISGTPTAVGSSQFGVYFRDGDGRVAAKVFTVAVTAAGDGPVISTATLPGGSVGSAYTGQLQTVGNVAGTWSVTTGALPAGLALNATTGAITGTPTAVGTSTFTVQFKDAANKTATKQLSIVVAAADQLIVTATLPNGIKGTAYSTQLQSKNNVTGTWSISQGSLPAGLSLNNGSGVISGTPTAVGKTDFTVRFQDGAGNVGTRPLSIVVTETAAVIATTALPNGVAGVPYATQLHTIDDRAGTWSIATGTLPPGLTLTPATGVISGTPTGAAVRDFTVRFTDANGAVSTRDLSIIIEATAPEISTVALPSGVKDSAYSQVLRVKDSRPGLWDVASGQLPPGLELNPTTGVISGTPTAAGTYPFTIRFRDLLNVTDTQALAIAITEAGAPVIATATLPVGKVNQAYTGQLTTVGGQPGTWSISAGTLPAGLALNATTGAITGKPTAKGTSTFTVRFANGAGVATTKQLSIQVQSCFLIFCS